MLITRTYARVLNFPHTAELIDKYVIAKNIKNIYVPVCVKHKTNTSTLIKTNDFHRDMFLFIEKYNIHKSIDITNFDVEYSRMPIEIFGIEIRNINDTIAYFPDGKKVLEYV